MGQAAIKQPVIGTAVIMFGKSNLVAPFLALLADWDFKNFSDSATVNISPILDARRSVAKTLFGYYYKSTHICLF